MTTLDEHVASLAAIGRSRRYPVDDRPTVDDVLRGFSQDGGIYALKILLGGYLDAQERVGFEEGDTVRVRHPYVEQLARNGWQGYAAMFHDAEGTVRRVQFSPVHGRWHVDVAYEPAYCYSDYPSPAGTFYIKEGGPRLFMMWPEYIKRVKS